MKYTLSIPARINILGNPGDATEGDFATISAAIDIYASAMVEPSENIILEFLENHPTKPDYKSHLSNQRVVCSPDQIPLPYNNKLDILKAPLNRLYNFSDQLRERIPSQGIRIAVWTEVPRQSGLGGSSLLVLLVLASLRAYYDLDSHIHNDYVLAELAQKVESEELGITCGFADRYMPLFGGLAYLDYRGKLYHRNIYQEPYVTYETLNPFVSDMPLIAISSGIKHDSGDIHGQMRPKYITEFDQWQVSGGKKPPMVEYMSGAWDTAWRGKIAILERDWKTFGNLMNTNHQLVNQMMTYCGFDEGAGRINNILIETALKNGALGAKLTGAGGGGSVFALTKPGDEHAIASVWEKAIIDYELITAKIFRPQISQQGLNVKFEE